MPATVIEWEQRGQKTARERRAIPGRDIANFAIFAGIGS